MLIDNLNLNHVRVFECVFRARSMTIASSELHLTQSGVSQHIKSLEDMLGVKLFDRIKQRLIPTAAAETLYRTWSESLKSIDRAVRTVKGRENELQGTVSIGLPVEFGNNVILPLLAKFGKKHPEVRFRIKLEFVSAINEMLLRGDLDFAFIDDFSRDKRITTQKVYDEMLELCISEDALKDLGPSHIKEAARQNSTEWFESLPFVEYQEGEPILRQWFTHHLNARHPSLDVKAFVMDVQGVARLILSGLGAGILPGYLVAKLQKEGHRLHRFKGSGKPLTNSISVAYLKERSHSSASLETLEFLRKSLIPEA